MQQNAGNHEKNGNGKHRPFISSAATEVISLVTSFVAAGTTAWQVVQSRAYKNLSSLGAFDDMKPKRKKDFDAIELERDHALVSPEQAFLKVDALVEVNEREAERRMTNLGISNIGKKWGILRAHQKVEAASYAFIAGGVALGAALPLLREMTREQAIAEDAPETGATRA